MAGLIIISFLTILAVSCKFIIVPVMIMMTDGNQVDENDHDCSMYCPDVASTGLVS